MKDKDKPKIFPISQIDRDAETVAALNIFGEEFASFADYCRYKAADIGNGRHIKTNEELEESIEAFFKLEMEVSDSRIPSRKTAERRINALFTKIFSLVDKAIDELGDDNGFLTATKERMEKEHRIYCGKEEKVFAGHGRKQHVTAGIYDPTFEMAYDIFEQTGFIISLVENTLDEWELEGIYDNKRTLWKLIDEWKDAGNHKEKVGRVIMDIGNEMKALPELFVLETEINPPPLDMKKAVARRNLENIYNLQELKSYVNDICMSIRRFEKELRSDNIIIEGLKDIGRGEGYRI